MTKHELIELLEDLKDDDHVFFFSIDGLKAWEPIKLEGGFIRLEEVK